MLYGFSLVSNMRTYAVELRERNYPEFKGTYNAYIAGYGQLSGEYLGCIDVPYKMEVTEKDIPELLLNAEQFLKQHSYNRFIIW